MEREQCLDVALKSRDLEEKQEWLRTCLNADATNEYLWEYLLKICKLLGDIRGVEECAYRVARQRSMYMNVGMLHLGSNDEAAVEAFDEEIREHPEYALAWLNKGVALHNLNRHEAAIQCYNKVLDISVVELCVMEACFQKGLALVGQRKFSESIRYFDRVLEIDPGDIPSWAGKGEALFTLGRNEEAIVSYEEALKIRPDTAADNLKQIAKERLQELKKR